VPDSRESSGLARIPHSSPHTPRPMRRHSLSILPLLLGASCAGPAPAPQAPAASGTPSTAAAPKAAPAAPRASGKPEIRYYEIADA